MKNLFTMFNIIIFPLVVLFVSNVWARIATPDSINVLDKSKIYNVEERTLERNSRSMLADIAQTFAQKSGTTSQVLNLNLSNLLILLILKALVFGAGYLGNQGHTARELKYDHMLSEGEMSLALGYLIGDTCLYRAACEQPYVAKNYLRAAEMIFQTMKLIFEDSTVDANYKQTINEFRQAIEYGMKEQCPIEYTCRKNNTSTKFVT